MRSSVGFAALYAGLTMLLSPVVAQNSTTFPDYVLAMPEAERIALSQVVEDDPNDITDPAKDWISPLYPLIFKTPLPIPPIKEPLKKLKNQISGGDIWYYEMDIKPYSQQVYTDRGAAHLVGYDGVSPGPTIIVPRGVETVVRFVNNAALPNSVHLHGSYSRAPFDGWAEDVTNPGEFKDYYYPNQQSARMLWYHDHAVHITAENAYMGQAGAYIITDPAEDALNLPAGYGKYDIPLVLTAKSYQENGDLVSTNGEEDSFWGDVIHVNGQPWPFLNVEPRKYRFRFLDAAVSRSFALYFSPVGSSSAKIPFQVIASDAGLLESPQQVSNIFLANAERYEVVFDFSQYAGQAIDLLNLPGAGGPGVEKDYSNTDKVMRFIVGDKVAAPDTSVVPSALRTVPFPKPVTNNAISHFFRFHRQKSEWRINGITFADVNNRMLANVPRGTVEIWELENSSGGWSHPIHIHLIDFRVLARDGPRSVMPYEAAGLKDVVWLGRNEKVLVEAHYAPWDGVYMFHCHNLIHEDHDMMAAFNVTALPDFGYDEKTHFIDPMEQRWRAKPFGAADFKARTGAFSDANIEAAVAFLADTDAYSKVDIVNQNLDSYWAAKGLKARKVGERQAEGPIPRYMPRQ
ncbi:bilirubin oxidase [Pyricularia oryzae 70-15]|uniref:Bilirubin oxidase n=3 Tax=Pyricularia oryzae TaxID=318829 RepID=G4MQU0_PYRO7|nr:bilirubin oxidase [Pyricularia oryzae 70-15]EHA58171.1 bilirubin oxidase [Pyricularia oryzae 70-15]ELQ42349.1 bilirubin oxidase [Pyricularia oryzae Y34]KAI7916835.1 bilirubin oxidase [Pyricularia oryzae]